MVMHQVQIEKIEQSISYNEGGVAPGMMDITAVGKTASGLIVRFRILAKAFPLMPEITKLLDALAESLVGTDQKYIIETWSEKENV